MYCYHIIIMICVLYKDMQHTTRTIYVAMSGDARVSNRYQIKVGAASASVIEAGQGDAQVSTLDTKIFDKLQL